MQSEPEAAWVQRTGRLSSGESLGSVVRADDLNTSIIPLNVRKELTLSGQDSLVDLDVTAAQRVGGNGGEILGEGGAITHIPLPLDAEGLGILIGGERDPLVGHTLRVKRWGDPGAASVGYRLHGRNRLAELSLETHFDKLPVIEFEGMGGAPQPIASALEIGPVGSLPILGPEGTAPADRVGEFIVGILHLPRPRSIGLGITRGFPSGRVRGYSSDVPMRVLLSIHLHPWWGRASFT